MRKIDDTALIFTDGGLHKSNPGPGGYAAIIRQGLRETVVTGGFAWTTNNRMELLAAVAALELLPADVPAVVVSDSQYVVNGALWARKWQRNGWRLVDGGAVRNEDLWRRLRAAIDGRDVRFAWTRGHAGHPENERCDRLAAEAARLATAVDVGYAPANG